MVHIQRIIFAFVLSFITLTAANTGGVDAANAKQSTIIQCVVTNGRGISNVRSPTGNAVSARPEFKPWVLAGDGVKIEDRITLYWQRMMDGRPQLRVAIDGPVSKPAHLFSITDNTVVAIVLTSDQDTTRSWQFSINFRRQDVMATGIASNANRLSGQLIVLSCTFEARENSDEPMAEAADHWQ